MSESEAPDQKLPKKVILRKKSDFNEVFKKGSVWSGRYMKCLFLESNRRTVGFVVSRRFGKAVLRIRAKRRMREVFRKKQHGVGLFKMVIMPNRGLDRAPFHELEADFDRFIEWSTSLKNG
jgi:ribonuclease P protein component